VSPEEDPAQSGARWAELLRDVDDPGAAAVGFEHTPLLCGLYEGPDLRVAAVNQAFRNSVGRRLPTGVPLLEAMPELAGQETVEVMRRVVESGTGTAAQIPGLQVAGKTGTAQHAQGRPPHAWFIGFTSSGDRAIAVAVVVENGGSLGSEATGGHVAAPIARRVMETYIRGGG